MDKFKYSFLTLYSTFAASNMILDAFISFKIIENDFDPNNN